MIAKYATNSLLFSSKSIDAEANTPFLNVTIDYILSSERFEEPLL